jgi:hypothetical protein
MVMWNIIVKSGGLQGEKERGRKKETEREKRERERERERETETERDRERELPFTTKPFAPDPLSYEFIIGHQSFNTWTFLGGHLLFKP